MRVLLYQERHGQLPEAGGVLARVLQEERNGAKGAFEISNDEVWDPWGTPYRYQLVDNSFEVLCAGPDGRFNTGDDLTGDRTVVD